MIKILVKKNREDTKIFGVLEIKKKTMNFREECRCRIIMKNIGNNLLLLHDTIVIRYY